MTRARRLPFQILCSRATLLPSGLANTSVIATRGASREREIQQKPSPRMEESSLPLIQRCKNLLAANWRAQITTINVNGEDPNASKVHGSLVNFMLVAGKPILWLPKNDTHEVNLLLDERGSMVVGHTDPPPLVRAWREVGHVPPRAMLLGSIAPLPHYERDYFRKRILKAQNATNEALKEAGSALHSVLEKSGKLLNSRAQALAAIAEASDAEFSVFRLTPK